MASGPIAERNQGKLQQLRLNVCKYNSEFLRDQQKFIGRHNFVYIYFSTSKHKFCLLSDATIYVGGLDEKVTETLLWELFVQAGPVGEFNSF